MAHKCREQKIRMDREYLSKFFRYDQNTGILYHADDAFRRFAGKPAGSDRGRSGYLTVNHRRNYLSVHRVAWALVHGHIDSDLQIDHVNGITYDNRIENLRLVTNKENHLNKSLTKRNSSGLCGVDRRRSLFRVAIQGDHIGYFKDFFEACCARKGEELRRGFHINHGRARTRASA